MPSLQSATDSLCESKTNVLSRKDNTNINIMLIQFQQGIAHFIAMNFHSFQPSRKITYCEAHELRSSKSFDYHQYVGKPNYTLKTLM